MKFETTNSEELYRGKAINLWRERVLYPDGRAATVEIIKHPGAVTILPVDKEGNIWFVRQYRHPAGQMLLELPAGTLEIGEDPQNTAAREIREEIGMAAESLEELIRFYPVPGYSTEYMYAYLATGLYPAPLAQDESEFIQVEKYPIVEAYAMFERGEIIDGKTLAVLALVQKRLTG
ncbi:MAG: NUDIX hydrolase [Anaerolineales bacterium]|nr:NUDIX hydrolase [Anaerolineales bacterium]